MWAPDLVGASSRLVISNVQTLVYRAPIDTPVQTSFGTMRDRSAVLVRLTDEDGLQGWGEVWCNFPAVGAEHRARLLIDSVAPLVMDQPWAHPAELFDSLTRRLHVLGVQTGEPGPIAQVIAGLDIALWDLAAKRAAQPLWQLLGGSLAEVKVYASGLNPTEPERLAAQRAAEGHRAFKLKVGFGEARDTANLRALRAALGDGVALMIDANQAWDVEAACRMSERLAEQRPLWLEEPIGADLPVPHWLRLAQRSAIPLAAGENFRGDAQFDEFLNSGALHVLQPDVAKWGGFSRCVALGQRTVQRDVWLCPHWLGGGIGLVASLHLKAAIGGDGFVEIDANPNSLRNLLALPEPQIQDGATRLSERPGLGVEPDLEAAAPFLVQALTVDAANPSRPQAELRSIETTA